MAEVAVAPDEDEKYLYGENTDATKQSNDGVASVDTSSAPASGVATPTDSQESKKDDEDDEDGEFEESDDDDDDNIQVHIGEVNAATPGPYGTPVNWKKDGVAAAAKVAALPTQGQKKIDVNAVGLINGQPIYEYDLDTEQDEKPWRKPGADISDYFNYGFNEDTWKQYCEKQRRMRMESQRSPYTVTQAANPANSAQVEIEVLPDGRTRVRAGPPPDRKVEGSIHVLGSNADARRKQKEDELLALALGSTRVMAPQTFPGQRPIYTGGVSSAMSTVVPNGLQYLGPNPGIPGIQQMMPPGAQFLPPPGAMGMEFAQQDPFIHPGAMLPPVGNNYGQFPHSDSDFDSDGENRRHRKRESKHRRHRDRSDRDRDRDKDRDRDRSSRRDRDRSDRRTRDHSKAPSDSRKSKHSSRSASSARPDDDDRKPSRSSRRSKQSGADSGAPDEDVKKEPIEVKQEPTGD